MNSSRVWKGENLQHHRVDFGNRSRLKQVRGLAVADAKRFPDELKLPTVAEGGRIRYDVLSRYACRKEIFSVISSSFPCYEPTLNCSIRCGHVLLTTEKVRAVVDNIRGKKDRDIEGES